MRNVLAAAIALSVVISSAANAQEKSTGKPNIVFIVADDAGYGDYGFTGHPYAKTPNIDRLAKQSAFFKNFYVSGPVCSPTRTGIMTGRFPATFQKIPASHGFSGATTITELLRQVGYYTGHFGKWHIGPETNPGTYGIDEIKVIGGNRKDPRGRDADTSDSVVSFLKANKEKTFFVNVWFHTPHNPVNPPQSYVDRFASLIVNPADFKGPHMGQYLIDEKKAGENVDVEMRKRMGDLAQLDEQVGRVLKALDDLGLTENTIVLFTSDNGPNPFGYAGIFRGRKHSLHEGGVHQPLLVRWPGRVTPGRVDAQSVLAGVDCLPTLCAITGAKMPSSKLFGGEDVSDVWLGKERARKTDLFWRTFAPKGQPVMLRGSWKLHQERKGSPQLFDLAKDPSELLDVSVRHPEVVRELTTAINCWAASLPKSYIGSDPDKDD